MLRLFLFAASLAAAPAVAPGAADTAKVLSGKELFDARAAGWKELRTSRLEEHRAMLKAFADQPQIVSGLQREWRGHLEWQAMQMALVKGLKDNQDEAVKDGVIDEARRDLHNGKLDRLVSERLLFLWGNTAPSKWNSLFEGVAKLRKVPGYPFPVYPSKKEFDSYSSKDFLPVYEKAEKRMKTMSLDEAAK